MTTPTQADVELVANMVERAAKRWPHCKFELAQLVAEQREQAIATMHEHHLRDEALIVQRTDELRTVRSELETIKAGHGELGRYEELRLKNAELLRVLKAISDLWITEAEAGANHDALAERMAKLALAATLRKTP